MLFPLYACTKVNLPILYKINWVSEYYYYIFKNISWSRGPSLLPDIASHPSPAVTCFVSSFVYPFHTSFPFRLSNISDQLLGFSLTFKSTIRIFRDYSKPCRRDLSLLALATLCYFRTTVPLFQVSSWTLGGLSFFWTPYKLPLFSADTMDFLLWSFTAFSLDY